MNKEIDFTKKALVPIANGTEEMEAVIIVDMMRRAGIEVKVVSDEGVIVFSRGIKIIPDIIFKDIDEHELFDAIILPGGIRGTDNLLDNKQLEDLIKAHHGAGKLIGAICAAPKILSAFNIINDDEKVTSHPDIRNELSRFDYSDEKVVVHNNIVTSRGAGTAFDFVLKIIEIMKGKEKSNEIAKEIVYF